MRLTSTGDGLRTPRPVDLCALYGMPSPLNIDSSSTDMLIRPLNCFFSHFELTLELAWSDVSNALTWMRHTDNLHSNTSTPLTHINNVNS